VVCSFSQKIVEAHQGNIDDISIYGQESNQTTWRLAKMNLAIRVSIQNMSAGTVKVHSLTMPIKI
jgi:type I restriction-modification system DNA methylase subunit